MHRILLLAVLLFAGGAASAQSGLGQLKSVLGGSQISSGEAGSGLKEALSVGVSKGSDLVSQVDGFYKNDAIRIPFPPEARNVEQKLRRIGMGAEVDKFVLSLNRAAEEASKEAKPIFLSAVREMNIQDAVSILRGPDDAATQYLSRATSAQLKDKFKPIIQRTLDMTNASGLYTKLIDAYNKIPFVQKMNPSLDEYATGKTVEGLFIVIAGEEKNIRSNPAARTSELLKKVFQK